MISKDMVNLLTLDEKIRLISGKDFWHLLEIDQFKLPSIMVADGPHGLRKQKNKGEHIGLSESVLATCYPTASLLASTWDTDLIENLGKHLGEECLSEGVSVLLGPGANIKRSPLCGRNFEYFSEDPLLSGKLASSWIKGVQSKGIGASLKHFALNNQETRRMVVDTIVDERTMRELYLKSFEIAIKESHPWTVMASYNLVNGLYATEHPWLLKKVLRDDWKYKGLVVTDWGACNHRVQAIKAGLDLEMPGSHGVFNKEIKSAIKQGQLQVEDLNERVENVINLIIKANETLKKPRQKYDESEHHQFARKIASEGIVLLKNEDSILPLHKGMKIGLIGQFSKNPRFQGNGSSLINPTMITSLYDALHEEIKDNLYYADGYHLLTDEVDQVRIEESLEIAKKVDVVIVMAGLTEDYESEGFDRKHLHLPESHNELIAKIAKTNPNIIVCLSNGAPVLMPWINDVKGIVEGYLGGQASGLALMDVLLGKVNPSGKLAETFPKSAHEFPSSNYFPGIDRQVQYREGLYVGYRAYDSMHIDPLFPFGFGLSYTTFCYENLDVEKNDNDLTLKVRLKNIGKMDGSEIIQAYVSKEASLIYRPVQELKGFKKIYLAANQSKEIEIKIPMSDLSIYQNGFKLESGKYFIRVGSSSRDIHLTEVVEISSNDVIEKDHAKTYRIAQHHFEPSTEDFELLYGKTIPLPIPNKPYHLNSTLGDIKHLFLGKQIVKMVKNEYGQIAGENPSKVMLDMLEASIFEMPLRSLVLFSDGKLSKIKAEALIDFLNKKPIKGFVRLIKG